MPTTGIVKYHVKLKFDVDGLVEKADIIGAIFGQTEGLLGPEMNLNELQKVSKVGRIEVNVETKGNMTKGDALIPMSTDISTAALIAAAIESIDKVGPFPAKFGLVGIDDIRAIKKKVIVDRAKKIVQDWATRTISEGDEMLKVFCAYHLRHTYATEALKHLDPITISVLMGHSDPTTLARTYQHLAKDPVHMLAVAKRARPAGA